MKSPSSLFVPKDCLTLQAAVAEAEQAPQFSQEVDKISSVVTWFRGELYAKSFSCSYFSSTNKLYEIPYVVFAYDESIGLFESGIDSTVVSEASPPEIDLAFLHGNNLFKGHFRTYIDQGPNSPYYILDELDSARGKVLFISKEPFKKALSRIVPRDSDTNKQPQEIKILNKRRGPKPKVDPTKFYDECHRILTEEGMVNPQVDPSFRQVDLEKKMMLRHRDAIGVSRNRALVSEAIDSFVQSKSFVAHTGQ